MMVPEEQSEIEKAFDQLEALQKARIPDIPPLYEDMRKDSPTIKTSAGLECPLVDLLSTAVMTGGLGKLKDALKDAGQINLEELVSLAELSIQPVSFSERDVDIIRLLYRNPLLTRAAIGRELKLHRSTIAHRLIRLVWTDAIRCYPLPDWHYFGIARLGFLYNCSKFP
ncbi:MAG: hypothetical protein ACFFB3_20255, partial [Candidatus Hodarchaeota archaeon]